MASVFTSIINGDLPGRFVWRDEVCVAFLTIAPISHGHALVVPIEEIDHWVDVPEDTNAHMMRVAQRISVAQMAAFAPERVGLIIAGLEVPHTHLHAIPMTSMADLDFRNANPSADPTAMDEARAAIVAALRDAGHDPGVD